MKDCFFKELKQEVDKLRLKTKCTAEAIDSVNNKVDLQHYRIEDIKEEISMLSRKQDILTQYLSNTQRQVEELLESSYESDEEECDQEEENEEEEVLDNMIEHVQNLINLCGYEGFIKVIKHDE